MFFEVSAKTGENVNRMMYTCIAELPFFEQFKIENNDALIQELMKTNSNNNEWKVINVKNRNKANLEKDGNMSSNIVLTKKNSKDDKKKKCAC